MNLREAFPHAVFAPPATGEMISNAEAVLGVTLPKELRVLYQQCDGFREERGNAKYLLSLIEDDFIGSLVTITKHLWEEANFPRLTLFLFFGSSSGDEIWGINWSDPREIISYHHHMEGDFEVVGSNVLDVWKADYALYDEIDLDGS